MAWSGLCATVRSWMSVESAYAQLLGRGSGLLSWLTAVALLALSSRRWGCLSGWILALMFASLSVSRSWTRTLLSQSLTDFGCTFSHMH